MRYLSLFVLFFLMASCYKEITISAGDGLEDWSTSTHSASAIPQYDAVFPQESVNRFDITITSDDWADMQSDLDGLYGSSSNTGPGGGGPGGGGGGTTFAEENPIYVPCNIEFNGKNWYKVGIRYKGNSSLSAASSGTTKLPFRLEFDEFSNDYPEINGQTFYGFSALSMSSNYNDPSVMREKVACDLFREFGIPAPYSAFYELYVDYGDGPIYFGLYTAVEVVFETMLNKQFGSESGNCYKPEDEGASFSKSGFNLNDFANKTTGGTGESDIQSLYDFLHSDDRTSDTTRYKSNLESVLDVQGFLKWLAANTTIQNWDTYGRMTHNYFLYNNPETSKLTWIPWDNNESLQSGKREGSLNLDFSNLNATQWPIIGNMYQDEVYKAKYDQYVQSVVDGAFETNSIQALYSKYASLIEPYATTEVSGYTFLRNSSGFQTAVSQLNSHASQRAAAVNSYLRLLLHDQW
ncbi:MAG: CotH kinase family protein [Marinicellaceae bacterium]